MSHILAAATAIKFPVKDAAGQKSAALLNQAYAAIEETLQLMAATSEPQTQSYRGHAAVTGVQNFILDYYGKETRKQGSREIRLGLFAKDVFRGIGVYVDPETGALSFLGDKWGYERQYEELGQAIVRNYTALQMRNVLVELGYEVEAAEAQGTLTLTGTAYA
jgi:hypothetical protein